MDIKSPFTITPLYVTRNYDKKNKSFAHQTTILTNTPNDYADIICGEKRDDIFGYWFKVLSSKLKNVSIHDAVDRDRNYYTAPSRIIDSLVTGDIEADGISPLTLNNTRVKGDVFSSEEGKQLLVDKKSILEKDINLKSKGNMKVVVNNGSVVLGSINCDNTYDMCESPEVYVKNKSKVKKDIVVGSDSGKVYINNSNVNEICFDIMNQQSKTERPFIDIRNKSVVQQDIIFYSKKGRVVIEEGSKVKGRIHNADIIYTDKQGNIINQESNEY